MGRCLLNSFLLIFLASACAKPANVSPFVGTWEVALAPDAEAIRVQEIRYPVWLEINQHGKTIHIRFKDQFDQWCEPTDFFLTNEGNDLVFSNCGITKEPDSYAPLHHIKQFNNKLVGVVSTSENLFVWRGKRAKDTP